MTDSSVLLLVHMLSGRDIRLQERSTGLTCAVAFYFLHQRVCFLLIRNMCCVICLQDASVEVSRHLCIKPRASNCLTHCCHGLTTATDPSSVTLLSGQSLLCAYLNFSCILCRLV